MLTTFYRYGAAGRARWTLTVPLRHCELRWMGKHVQWVVSPVQVACWTGIDRPEYRTRVNMFPLRRTVS